MQSTFLPAVINMRRIGILASATLCILLPLVLGAPASDDSLKQQIASGLLRGDDFWSSLNQGRFYDGYPSRRPSSWAPHNYQKRFDSLSGDAFGLQKRNFDEIDRNGFGSFVKRNFDEIDRNSFGNFVKRNFDEIDRTGLGFHKKRNENDGYGSIVKRFVL
ncbi:orcokinin peptides type A isoform X2 [Folsomia candida]|uniref:orcokinin peptides type A isoform X2 n=1 Tax=Folsomia candida TaxID=158441 RepID=UPI000B909546|nr:orcokinin peptides type A isoform X2 [Folsomia candida]